MTTKIKHKPEQSSDAIGRPVDVECSSIKRFKTSLFKLKVNKNRMFVKITNKHLQRVKK